MNMRARLVVPLCVAAAVTFSLAQTVNLPTSKRLLKPLPGSLERLNSLPMTAAWSPDGRYLALVNAGYGTVESDYEQSIAILDTATGKLTDTPDPRTASGAPQTMYSGIAFSLDGKHIYVSFDSLSAPEGVDTNSTGNAIAVYTLDNGGLRPERLIPIPLQRLAPGHYQNPLAKPLPEGIANPLPTGIAVVRSSRGSEQLLVADEFSDDVLLVDLAAGKVEKRFDLAANPVVPSTYPIAVVATRDNRRAFVALWNGSAIAELDLRSGTILGKISLLAPRRVTDPSSHPIALTLSPDEKTIYVALANRDSVAAIHLTGNAMRLERLYDTRLPGQTYFGAMPDALAVSTDGNTLYVANSGSNTIAVFKMRRLLNSRASVAAEGFLPTEWYPTALALKANKLYVATAKAEGTGPNVAPRPEPSQSALDQQQLFQRPHTYIASLLHGSLALIDRSEADQDLKELTRQAVASNLRNEAHKHVEFRSGMNPIRHVIYIIRENRTYDQLLGDLGVGDGDPSLTMYGRPITPNLHKLAMQFGVLDNFYDSGEVSGDGHMWSTAGITSDYTERNWQQAYRGNERLYDFEGVVEQGYPVREKIPDVNEPASSYLWTNLASHGRSFYHFGEYISTKFCDDEGEGGEAPKDPSPLEGTPEFTRYCNHPFIRKGDHVPANYGGGTSPYPWPIPLVYQNVATKSELVGHFDPKYPDFNLRFPDQLRVNEFLGHFNQWVSARIQGRDDMPAFVMLRLPNDHTAGTSPGLPTPKASVADNDLAVGRAVEAVAHSPYWADTVFFILEDDAQDGADHVDAHRSIALIVSKYSPLEGHPVIDHTFYTTVSMLHTMEDLLGLPPMNNNDAFAPLIMTSFAGVGNQPPFSADYSNRENGLIYTANTWHSPGARGSSRMDFTHEDRADARKLNVILWKDAMGEKPVPWMILHPHVSPKDDDGD